MARSSLVSGFARSILVSGCTGGLQGHAFQVDVSGLQGQALLVVGESQD